MKYSIRRIAAVAVAAGFLLAAWLLYRGDFWSLRTEAQVEAAIVAYASADPEDTGSLKAVLHPAVLHDEVVQGRRIVTFTDREIGGLLGHIQFRRGILGGWQPLSAAYGAGPVIKSLRVKDREALVVFAADCPPEIAHYKVQANLDNDATRMAEGDVTAPSFFHVYETDRDYFPEMHLYDRDGVELDAWAYQAVDQSVPAPGIGSAEVDLVYWFCAMVLGVGWLIVKYLWELPRPKEAEEGVSSSGGGQPC